MSKWNSVQFQQQKFGATSEPARSATFNLIAFILKKYQDGSLQPPAGYTAEQFAAALTQLINQLFCNVGLTDNITSLDAFVISPTDGPQTFVTSGGQTGASFPGSAVSENAILTVVPGDEGNLDTPLDQYAFVENYNLQPPGALKPGVRVTLSVCPQGISISNTPLLDRLRLGHQGSVGFGILPEPTAADPPPPPLNCTSFLNPSSQASAPIRLLRQLVQAILPKRLYARVFRFDAGGASGTTGEFSPFGPVDPLLEFSTTSGGASGSTGEFAPPIFPGAAKLQQSCSYGHTVTVNGVTYPVTIEGPVQTEVDAGCRPSVTIKTLGLQTAIANVPISFRIGTTVGGGFALPQISDGALRYLNPQSLLCSGLPFKPNGDGSPSNPVNDGSVDANLPVTNSQGVGTTCGTFGSVGGHNSIVAVPQLDDLPASLQGVVFCQDCTAGVPDASSLLWVMRTNPADHMEFSLQPAATETAGTPFDVKVRLLDANNVQTGSSNAISLLLQNAGLASPTFNGPAPVYAAIGPSVTVNASGGEAAFNSLIITKAATGYKLNASTSGLPDLLSNSFDVVAAPAASILTNMPAITGYVPPAAQYTYAGLLTAGQPAVPAPKVLVRDPFGNPVSGELVSFNATNSTVSPASGNTGADGQLQLSANSWILGIGQSDLLASIADHFPLDGSSPDPAAFFANTPIGASTFVCELGTKDGSFFTFDSNRNKVDVGPIRVKEPNNVNTVDFLFFMSVTGQSSSFTPYPVDLKVYRGTLTSPGTGYPNSPVGFATGSGVQVLLPGDNGKPALQTIHLTSPVLKPAPGGTTYLWFYLTVLNPPAQRTFQLWYTPKLDKTTSDDCKNAAVYNAALTSSKLGPAVLLKN